MTISRAREGLIDQGSSLVSFTQKDAVVLGCSEGDLTWTSRTFRALAVTKGTGAAQPELLLYHIIVCQEYVVQSKRRESPTFCRQLSHQPNNDVGVLGWV